MYLQDMLDLTYQTDYAYDIDNADSADNDLQKTLKTYNIGHSIEKLSAPQRLFPVP